MKEPQHAFLPAIWPWWLIKLILLFLYRLLVANLQLSRDILRPTIKFNPVIFSYRAAGLSAWQLALLANIISLTPGTLVVDIDKNENLLMVHCLYGNRLQLFQNEIADFANLIMNLSLRHRL